MKSYLNAFQIANQILMLKGKREGVTFLIVEGKTDSVGYSWFTNRNKCITISAHSKENVIDAIQILENRNVSGIIGIVDADFSNLEGHGLPSNNLVKTDSHDIEMLILNSPALEKVMHVNGDDEKCQSIEKVTDKLLSAAKPLGYIRWVSLRRKLDLNFKDLNFTTFVDKDTLEIDIEKLSVEVVNNTKRCRVKAEDIRKIIEYGLTNSSHDPWQVCCGHDVVEILRISFNSCFGSFTSPPKSKAVSSWLILAYESTYFTQTQLYSAIINWEKSNAPFLVLAQRYKEASQEVAAKIC